MHNFFQYAGLININEDGVPEVREAGNDSLIYLTAYFRFLGFVEFLNYDNNHDRLNYFRQVVGYQFDLDLLDLIPEDSCFEFRSRYSFGDGKCGFNLVLLQQIS